MDLRSILSSYTRYFLPSALAELGWFRSMQSLELCIDYATLAKNMEGKRFKHQGRIRIAVLWQARGILLANIQSIKRTADFD
jgi:hypothetical protein